MASLRLFSRPLAGLVAAPLLAAMAGCSADAPNDDGEVTSSGALTYATAAACREPRVDDCSFYRECLEPRHPCGDDGYGLSFGAPMCQLYIDQKSEFSPAGQAWLRGVRHCLQRELVPKLDEPMSCDDVERFAFQSHVRCYTEPGNSICDLDAKDRVTLVHVTGGALLRPESLSQMTKVIATCAKDLLTGGDADK